MPVAIEWISCQAGCLSATSVPSPQDITLPVLMLGSGAGVICWLATLVALKHPAWHEIHAMAASVLGPLYRKVVTA